MPKPARLCCDVWKSIGGDKVASWTRFHGCLHASLCSLFSPYCPRLTGWCNSQQDHSFTPLLILLSAYSSSVPPPFPPSLSLPSPLLFPVSSPPSSPPSPLPPSLVRLLHHFSPFFSLSLPNLSLFLSLSHINQFLALFFFNHSFPVVLFPLLYFSLFLSSSLHFFPPAFPSFLLITLYSLLFCLSSFNSSSLSLCFSPYFFFFSVMECVMSLQLIPSLKHLSNAR